MLYGFDDGNLNPQVRFNYEYGEIGNLTQTDEVVGTAVTTTLYEYDDHRYLNTKITQKGAGVADKAVKFTYNAKDENTKIERYLDGLLKVRRVGRCPRTNPCEAITSD